MFAVGVDKKYTNFLWLRRCTASVSTCGVFSHLEPPEVNFFLFERKCVFSAIAMEAKWTPSSPEERAYYDRLFALADVSNSGKLGGDAVVPFLAKSGLGFGILKEVRKRELRFCHVQRWFTSSFSSLQVRPLPLLCMLCPSPCGYKCESSRLIQEKCSPVVCSRWVVTALVTRLYVDPRDSTVCLCVYLL